MPSFVAPPVTHLRHVPGQWNNSGVRSGAWCAFILDAYFHFCPDCTWHRQGRGGLHTSNAPGGWSLRQTVTWRGGGSNASIEPTGEQTSAEPTLSRLQRQSKPAPPVCYAVKHLTLNHHYTIKFQSALGSVHLVESGPRNEGKSWAEREERVEEKEERQDGPDQTMVDGDERLE